MGSKVISYEVRTGGGERIEGRAIRTTDPCDDDFQAARHVWKIIQSQGCAYCIDPKSGVCVLPEGYVERVDITGVEDAQEEPTG